MTEPLRLIDCIAQFSNRQIAERYCFLYDDIDFENFVKFLDNNLSKCKLEFHSDWTIECFELIEEGKSYFDVSGIKENEPIKSAIELQPWSKWLGAKTSFQNMTTLDFVCHCINEMTFYGYSEDDVASKKKEITDAAEDADRRIKAGEKFKTWDEFQKEMEQEDPFLKQVGGNHYKGFKIQPTEFIFKNDIGFVPGCIIKYACRAGLKGPPREDIEKIIHYAELWLGMLDKE